MISTLVTDHLQQNPSLVEQLGKILFENISEKNFPEQISFQECKEFFQDIAERKFFVQKSVVNDGLAKIFPEIKFEESDADLDHAGDIDYLGFISDKAFGIQIKPVTARSNFGNYSISERMKASFEDFSAKYGGKVFIVFSLDGEIANAEVIEQIRNEITRLQS